MSSIKIRCAPVPPPQLPAGTSLEENVEHFGALDVTVGSVLSVDQLMQDRHVTERQILVAVADPELGSVTVHNVFPRLSSTPGRFRTPAPKLGEHQDLVERQQPIIRRRP